MGNKKFNNKFISNISKYLKILEHDILLDAKKLILLTKKKKGEIFLFGNGASASIANHLAVDFTKENSIKARAFNNPSLITCFSNDFGYENLFKKCIESYAQDKDLCIFISSSGESTNVINGSLFCQKKI